MNYERGTFFNNLLVNKDKNTQKSPKKWDGVKNTSGRREILHKKSRKKRIEMIKYEWPVLEDW